MHLVYIKYFYVHDVYFYIFEDKDFFDDNKGMITSSEMSSMN